MGKFVTDRDRARVRFFTGQSYEKSNFLANAVCFFASYIQEVSERYRFESPQSVPM